MRRSATQAAAVVLLVAGLSACGSAGGGKGAQLVVSEDFGARSVADLMQPKLGAEASPVGLLAANLPEVKVGMSGSRRWSLFVNGIGADTPRRVGALHDGDVVWWDRHDTRAAGRVRAVVGSFPEPFRHGPSGKRLPLRIECSPAGIPACQTVQDAMTAAGVFAAQGGLQQAFTKETLRIIVGPWARIRDDDAARQLEAGPRASGVYARPAPDGRSIALLDGQGRITRRLGPGSGLVAATRFQDGQPVWIITAPDAAGVAAAAQALDQGNLKGHFALAVVDGRAAAVPEP